MSATSSVPQVSHCPIPYSVGQWDKSQQSGTTGGTENRAVSLKALAANVLRTVPPGTNSGTDGGTGQKTVGQKADSSGSFVPRPKASNWLHPSHASQVKQKPVSPLCVAPDTPNMEALALFEREPRGVVSWLARQRHGQPRHLSPRWVAVIQAEARLRLQEVEA
jgi:hypothetical protein